MRQGKRCMLRPAQRNAWCSSKPVPALRDVCWSGGVSVLRPSAFASRKSARASLRRMSRSTTRRTRVVTPEITRWAVVVGRRFRRFRYLDSVRGVCWTLSLTVLARFALAKAVYAIEGSDQGPWQTSRGMSRSLFAVPCHPTCLYIASNTFLPSAVAILFSRAICTSPMLKLLRSARIVHIVKVIYKCSFCRHRRMVLISIVSKSCLPQEGHIEIRTLQPGICQTGPIQAGTREICFCTRSMIKFSPIHRRSHKCGPR